jgi:hypothetical protein
MSKQKAIYQGVDKGDTAQQPATTSVRRALAMLSHSRKLVGGWCLW